jgi:hypothetical protein
MFNLSKTEWLKIKKYPAFWWIIGLTALSYPGIIFIFYKIYSNVLARGGQGAALVKTIIGNPFTFPEAWHTVAYASSIFVFIPAVVIIMLVTNEYTYKTHRQNIIDGWSRNEFMMAKMLDVLIISVLITLLYLAVVIVTGFVNIEDSTGDKWSQFYYIGLFALQTFAQLSLAFLVAFLVRKAFISLGIFIFYFIILEPILVGILKFKANDIGRFLPLEISDRLIPVPAFLGRFDRESYDKALASINIHILYTVLLTALVWWICFRVNSRKDL